MLAIFLSEWFVFFWYVLISPCLCILNLTNYYFLLYYEWGLSCAVRIHIWCVCYCTCLYLWQGGIAQSHIARSILNMYVWENIENVLPSFKCNLLAQNHRYKILSVLLANSWVSEISFDAINTEVSSACIVMYTLDMKWTI